MTERGMDDREPGEGSLVCPVCGASNLAGDRFCAECGAFLPPIPAEVESSAMPLALNAGASTPDASRSPRNTDQENAAWVLGARPTAVMIGGLLLLLLAAGLLTIGQRDETGTIVMLSICTAPLGLMVLVIGIARFAASAARRG